MANFPKPGFAVLESSYRRSSMSVHECRLLDPTQPETRNTCAARMSEALVIANALVRSREDISALGRGQGTERGRGDGGGYLLGTYGYLRHGHLCPHGIGRGAQALGAFLARHWGPRSLGWNAQASRTSAPAEIQGKNGVVLYARIPTFTGEGHIDLWKGNAPVGEAYWDAQTIWFWELP